MNLNKITFVGDHHFSTVVAQHLQENLVKKVLASEVAEVLKQEAQTFMTEICESLSDEEKSFIEHSISITAFHRQTAQSSCGLFLECSFVLINDDGKEITLSSNADYTGALLDEIKETCVFDVPYTAIHVENMTTGGKETCAYFIEGVYQNALDEAMAYMAGERHMVAKDMKAPSHNEDRTVAQTRMNAFNHVILNKKLGGQCDITIGKTVMLNKANYASIADTKAHPFNI